MKALAQFVVLAIAATAMCSCGLFDHGTSWQSGRFQVGWMDVGIKSSLSYRLDSNGDSIGIVEPCVFAAGANKRYVVVEQQQPSHPAVVSYYVLPKAGFNPLYPKQSLIGPLTKTAYHALAAQPQLPSVNRVVSKATCAQAG